MNNRTRKKTRTKLILYVYILIIFCTGFACGTMTAKADKTEAVEVQDVQALQAAEELTATAAPAPVQYKQITVEATAYCPCNICCGKCDGITATGTKATAGRTIAVDPSIIPYGTEVIINGHTYVAEDCGGAIKGNRIDIYFATHAEAVQFGRRILTAQVL